jgi:hypothetical protein
LGEIMRRAGNVLATMLALTRAIVVYSWGGGTCGWRPHLPAGAARDRWRLVRGPMPGRIGYNRWVTRPCTYGETCGRTAGSPTGTRP